MNDYDIRLINSLLNLKSQKIIQQNIRINSEIANKLNECTIRINESGKNINRTDIIILAVKLYLEFYFESIKGENKI